MDEPADLRDQATALRRQGYSYSQIGRRLGIHKSIVARSGSPRFPSIVFMV
jgi:transposase